MFNKVAKQQIIIKKNIRWKVLIPDNDNEEMNFLYKTTYLKILKAKGQLQASQPSYDSPFSHF